MIGICGDFVKIRSVAITAADNTKDSEPHRLRGMFLTSFFFRFLIGSGVSSSGDAAVPAARFLTLITVLFEGKEGDLK
jgi:hypothetical protein